jgi:hypothetical protein
MFILAVFCLEFIICYFTNLDVHTFVIYALHTCDTACSCARSGGLYFAVDRR